MKATILGPADIRIPSTAEHVAETGIHAARDVDTGYDPYRVVRGGGWDVLPGVCDPGL